MFKAYCDGSPLPLETLNWGTLFSTQEQRALWDRQLSQELESKKVTLGGVHLPPKTVKQAAFSPGVPYLAVFSIFIVFHCWSFFISIHSSISLSSHMTFPIATVIFHNKPYVVLLPLTWAVSSLIIPLCLQGAPNLSLPSHNSHNLTVLLLIAVMFSLSFGNLKCPQIPIPVWDLRASFVLTLRGGCLDFISRLRKEPPWTSVVFRKNYLYFHC